MKLVKNVIDSFIGGVKFTFIITITTIGCLILMITLHYAWLKLWELLIFLWESIIEYIF